MYNARCLWLKDLYVICNTYLHLYYYLYIISSKLFYLDVYSVVRVNRVSSVKDAELLRNDSSSNNHNYIFLFFVRFQYIVIIL